MKSRFSYLRPISLAEACSLTAAAEPGTRLLAGGTDLYLQWREGTPIRACVDISRLPGLAGIAVAGGRLRIGALTTLRTLERAAPRGGAGEAASGGRAGEPPGATAGEPVTGPELRALADLARVMCTPPTRSLATVGGNLGNASPGADLPPVLLALDAEVVVARPAGERRIGVAGLITGPGRTSLAPGEVITAVEMPQRGGRAVAVLRATRSALDIAQVIVAVSVATDDHGRIGPIGIGLGAVAPAPFRASAAEAVLAGRPVAAVAEGDLGEAARLASLAASPIDDVRAGAAYRREMTTTLTRRALTAALGRLRVEGST